MLDLPGIPKRHNPNVLGLQASLNDTLRRVGVFQASINDTLRGFEVSWLNGLSIPLNPTVHVRAKVQELSSHTLTSERRVTKERKNE